MLDTLQGNREITGNQLDNMRNTGFPHGFLTYKELGIVAKLQGKEKLGDREFYVLVFEPTAGSTIRQYIDAQSFMPTRFVLKVNVPQMGELEQTTELSDYRDVDGVKVPFKLVVVVVAAELYGGALQGRAQRAGGREAVCEAVIRSRYAEGA